MDKFIKFIGAAIVVVIVIAVIKGCVDGFDKNPAEKGENIGSNEALTEDYAYDGAISFNLFRFSNYAAENNIPLNRFAKLREIDSFFSEKLDRSIGKISCNSDKGTLSFGDEIYFAKIESPMLQAERFAVERAFIPSSERSAIFPISRRSLASRR